MKYKLAIFDMDGTILNTLEDLTDSVNHILTIHDYPIRTINEVKSFVGNGILRLIQLAVPENANISTETLNSLYNEFIEYYKIHNQDKTTAYDGVKELIIQLKSVGYKTAVVSNKADVAVKQLCIKYFDGLFDYSVGERTGIPKKPALDSVVEVLNKLQVANTDAVYIGDSEVDIATAKNSKMDSIIVSWGFREKDFLYSMGAATIVDSPDEIRKLLS